MTQFLASSTRGAQLFSILALMGTVMASINYGITFHALLLILIGYFFAFNREK